MAAGARPAGGDTHAGIAAIWRDQPRRLGQAARPRPEERAPEQSRLRRRPPREGTRTDNAGARPAQAGRGAGRATGHDAAPYASRSRQRHGSTAIAADRGYADRTG